MATITLEELKAQNAAEQEVKKNPVKDEYIEVDPDTEEPILEEEVEEVEEDVTIEEVEDNSTDTSNDSEDSEDSSDETEVLEEWQKSEDDEVADNSKKKGFIPNAGAAKLRNKLKDAKLAGKEDKSRIDELEAQIEALKVSSTPTQGEAVLPPRPKLEDFDYDDEKHNQAMDDWYDLRVDKKMSAHTDTMQQKRLKDAQVQAHNHKTETAVTGHLERAATLISGGKVAEDKWLAGDLKLRLALESHAPQAGDALADQFITLLNENGADSEKVWYYLGNNAKAFSEFTSKIASDPSGAQAIMYLAGIQNKFSQSALKKRSGAPKPTSKLKGDKAGGSGGKQQKAYNEAAGDPQKRIDLKRLAKTNGIDVSKW